MAGTQGQDRADAKCSFCLKGQDRVKELIAGPGVYICDQCVDLCVSILQEGDVLLERGAQRERTIDLNLRVSPVDGITVAIDSLITDVDGWVLNMAATPGWWVYPTPRTKRYALDVAVLDDRGGSYESGFCGSRTTDRGEDFRLRFHPPLDPAARQVTVTFAGETEETTVSIGLPGGLAR